MMNLNDPPTLSNNPTLIILIEMINTQMRPTDSLLVKYSNSVKYFQCFLKYKVLL